MDCEEGLFDVVKLMLNNRLIFDTFRINLNTQHVNEMTFLIWPYSVTYFSNSCKVIR